MSRYHDIAATLIDIECELRSLGQWDKVAPPPEALRSEQPFAVDRLSFSQWLQFVFIPRIRYLLDSDSELPSACAIAPMAEEMYRGLSLPIADLLSALEKIDGLISEP